MREEVVWRVNRADRHGVANLKFGGITASFLAGARKDAKSPVELKVDSDASFTLIIVANGAEKRFDVKKGSNIFKVD